MSSYFPGSFVVPNSQPVGQFYPPAQYTPQATPPPSSPYSSTQYTPNVIPNQQYASPYQSYGQGTQQSFSTSQYGMAPPPQYNSSVNPSQQSMFASTADYTASQRVSKRGGKKEKKPNPNEDFCRTNLACRPPKLKEVDKAVIRRQIAEENDDLPTVHHRATTIELLSTQEILNLAVVKVTQKESNSSTGNLWTVDDPQMGNVSPNVACDHCGTPDCIGHYGCIVFARPIFHPAYINSRDTTIIKILSCICPHCSNLLMDEETIKMYKIDRLRGAAKLSELAKKSENKPCRYSVSEDPRYFMCSNKVKYVSETSRECGMIVYKSEKTKDEGKFSAQRVLDIFSGVNNDDAKMMGFGGTEVLKRFIMEAMLVPPNHVRAPKMINGSTKVNPLTEKLQFIVGANIELQEAISSVEKSGGDPNCVDSIPDKIRKLFKEVAKYQEFVASLIQGKEALIRSVMNAKRGNNGGRAVISPCDDIELGQAIIPEYAVPYLCREMTVTNDNMQHIYDLIRDNAVSYITSKTGEYAGRIRKVIPGRPPEAYSIAPGDKVDRHLQEGDWVIINRQPSLNKQNMLGVRAVIGKNRSTVGVHLSVTPAIHGDFDGDEMSMWSLDEDEAKEVEERMDICKNMMSSQNSTNIVGLVIDSRTSAWRMTGDDTVVPVYIFMQCLTILKETDQLPTLEERLKEHSLGKIWSSWELEGILRREDTLFYRIAEHAIEMDRDAIVEAISNDTHTTSRSKRWNNLTLDGRVDLAILAIKSGWKGDCNKDVCEKSLRWNPNPLKGLLQMRRNTDTLLDDLSDLKITRDENSITLAILNDRDDGLRPESWRNKSLEEKVEAVKVAINDGWNMIPGKAVFSALLPANFQYKKGRVRIINGILVTGRISKDHVGNGHRTIIQDIHKTYGWQRAANFVTDATRVLRIFIDYWGHSVGYEDCKYGSTPEAKAMIRKLADEVELLNRALGPPTASNDIWEHERESKARAILSKFKDVSNDISLIMSDENNIQIMSSEAAGAKGSLQNTVQIDTMVGQPYYVGKRPERNLTNGTRTLSHFRFGEVGEGDDRRTIADYSFKSQGLCTNGYRKGLGPSDTFFQFVGARGGLSDTATKTAKVGEMQRKAGKALEDITTAPDGSVRNFAGAIFQFLYGGDGFNAAELLRVNDGVSFIDLNNVINGYNAEYGWVPDYKDEQRRYDEEAANREVLKQEVIEKMKLIRAEYEESQARKSARRKKREAEELMMSTYVTLPDFEIDPIISDSIIIPDSVASDNAYGSDYGSESDSESEEEAPPDEAFAQNINIGFGTGINLGYVPTNTTEEMQELEEETPGVTSFYNWMNPNQSQPSSSTF